MAHQGQRRGRKHGVLQLAAAEAYGALGGRLAPAISKDTRPALADNLRQQLARKGSPDCFGDEACLTNQAAWQVHLLFGS
jgi:hypothetical protein